MTEVAFHFNAPDKIHYACRLLRKVYAASARVVVVGTDELLSALDVALWTLSPTAFVPHCRADADASMVQLSPVLLMTPDQLSQPLTHHQVMLNLDSACVAGFESFEKVIEIVTHDDQDKTLARLRWKHYADRGYTLVRHDVSQKA